MKRLSISLFAILAIIFAFSSAFTVKQTKSTADVWYVYNNTSAQDEFGQGDTEDITAYTVFSGTEADPIAEGLCEANPLNEFVCAVELDPSEDLDGNHIEATSDIAYKFDE